MKRTPDVFVYHFFLNHNHVHLRKISTSIGDGDLCRRLARSGWLLYIAPRVESVLRMLYDNVRGMMGRNLLKVLFGETLRVSEGGAGGVGGGIGG